MPPGYSGSRRSRDAEFPLCRTPEEMELMRTLKRAMDPRGILNPGKVLA